MHIRSSPQHHRLYPNHPREGPTPPHGPAVLYVPDINMWSLCLIEIVWRGSTSEELVRQWNVTRERILTSGTTLVRCTSTVLVQGSQQYRGQGHRQFSGSDHWGILPHLALSYLAWEGPECEQVVCGRVADEIFGMTYHLYAFFLLILLKFNVRYIKIKLTFQYGKKP